MNETQLILCNDTALDDDGWALIAPFGEHPKSRTARINGVPIEQKFIQVLDNAAADALLSKENSLFGRLKRAVIGIPVYDGHPDLRDHSPETLANGGSKRQIGVVDQVRKGELGIEAHFVLSPEGATAVSNGSKFPSALWLVLPNGRRGDATLARPFKLLSVGLTAHPNISGVESLANARGAETAEQKEPDMKLIAGWLLGQGAALANTESPTESQVLEAFQKLHTAKAGEVVTLGNEKTQAAGKITTLENERTQLTGKVAALEKEKAEATTALANEQTARKADRVARIETAVDLAIAKGKLTVAKRAEQITALGNSTDLAADITRMLGAAKVIKTADDSSSGKVLANANMNDGDVRSTYCDAFKKHMSENPQDDPITAHKAVLKAHPALAEALKPSTTAADS